MSIELIKEALEELAKKRPIFWSEADFQFSFAWEIKRTLPNAEIRLERRVDIPSRKSEDKTDGAYIDIWVENEGKIIPIELKYKTHKFCGQFNGELFELKTQSACDIGSHNYIKDVWRIEQLSQREDFEKGYAIMITNEPIYWEKPNGEDTTTFRDFRIYDGRILNPGDKLEWRSSSDGSTNNLLDWQKKEGTLSISQSHKIAWNEYSPLNGKYGRFRYSVLEIIK